jgi:hypothetical protein
LLVDNFGGGMDGQKPNINLRNSCVLKVDGNWKEREETECTQKYNGHKMKGKKEKQTMKKKG